MPHRRHAYSTLRLDTQDDHTSHYLNKYLTCRMITPPITLIKGARETENLYMTRGRQHAIDAQRRTACEKRLKVYDHFP